MNEKQEQNVTEQPQAAQSVDPKPVASPPPVQQPGGYPYGYQPQYVVKEPSALMGVVFGILSLVILFFCFQLNSKVWSIPGWRGTLLCIYYILITLAQLCLGIVGLVVSRRAMKCRSCKRASVGFVFNLVDTGVGAMLVLQFLVYLIITLK